MPSTGDRSTALTRLTGVAFLLMAATVWPRAVFAADPAVETNHNAAVVFTVVVLLFGSVAAGLFFASPLRRRVSETTSARSVTQFSATDPLGTFEVQRRVALASTTPTPTVERSRQVLPQRSLQEQPRAAPALPSVSAQLAIPIGSLTPDHVRAATTQPAPTEAQASRATTIRPVAAPWSTGRPQPDANWNPDRHRAS